VPRRGVAVHINAFNFPVWGLLEFAPTFLAGMPCIAKPATSTSFLAEAPGAPHAGLRPAACRAACSSSSAARATCSACLAEPDLVTFAAAQATGAAARLCARTRTWSHAAIPFNAEADSLNCAILAPDVSPDDGVRALRARRWRVR
jgi:oxepin-CoA hydrolase/3-oxo-5,6-dehydrosuberyl-CoA semialdehyde dehydrogenase